MGDGFDDYVAQRHEGLRHTAYPLPGDRATAEDPVRTAPAKAWAAWWRIEGGISSSEEGNWIFHVTHRHVAQALYGRRRLPRWPRT